MFLHVHVYLFALIPMDANMAAAVADAVPEEAATTQNTHLRLAIGFVVIAGGFGAGHISGHCCKPAVAWVFDVSSAGIGFGWCLAYTVCELVWAVFAAMVFQVVRRGHCICQSCLAVVME